MSDEYMQLVSDQLKLAKDCLDGAIEDLPASMPIDEQVYIRALSKEVSERLSAFDTLLTALTLKEVYKNAAS